MKYTTGCNTIDGLMFGGFPENRLSGVFSFPNIGKSMLALQLCIHTMTQEDIKPLYCTTVSEADSPAICEIFNDRFGWVDSPDFCMLNDVSDLFDLMDIDISIDDSDTKVKVEMSRKKKKRGKEPKLKRKTFEDYDLLVIDTFSQLIKEMFAIETYNLPARSNVINRLFKEFGNLMNDFDLTVLLLHHSSQNPMSFMSTQNPYGGPMIIYEEKYLMQLNNADQSLYNKVGKRGKRVKRFRYAGKIESDYVPVVLKKDYGYIDLEDYEEEE